MRTTMGLALALVALSSSASADSLRGSSAPLRYMLQVSLLDPIGGKNATCFSNILTAPAPSGFRDADTNYTAARALIERRFTEFVAKCAARGRLRANPNVTYAWNADDGTNAGMLERHANYVAWGFPQVTLSD